MLKLIVVTFAIFGAFAVEIPKVTLNNGKQVPILGYGTFSGGPALEQTVQDAINAGYRHIDTAVAYRNEEIIGRGLKAAIANGKVKREELFLTSKVPENFHTRAKVPQAIKESCRKLGVDYLDLALIHWPMALALGDTVEPGRDAHGKILFSDTDYLETWQGMEDAVHQGLAKSIGLSNFNHFQVDRVLKNANIKPAVLQVESHPYYPNTKLINFAKNHNITVTAYSPLGHPPVSGDINNTEFLQIAHKHGKTVPQVVLRFNVQRDVIVIPKAVHKSHIIENTNIFNFTLSQTEMKTIEHYGHVNHKVVTMDEYRNHQYFPFKKF